jgi:hypothetical protein
MVIDLSRCVRCLPVSAIWRLNAPTLRVTKGWSRKERFGLRGEREKSTKVSGRGTPQACGRARWSSADRSPIRAIIQQLKQIGLLPKSLRKQGSGGATIEIGFLG